jgi:hypothetical protein
MNLRGRAQTAAGEASITGVADGAAWRQPAGGGESLSLTWNCGKATGRI